MKKIISLSLFLLSLGILVSTVNASVIPGSISKINTVSPAFDCTHTPVGWTSWPIYGCTNGSSNAGYGCETYADMNAYCAGGVPSSNANCSNPASSNCSGSCYLTNQTQCTNASSVTACNNWSPSCGGSISGAWTSTTPGATNNATCTTSATVNCTNPTSAVCTPSCVGSISGASNNSGTGGSNSATCTTSAAVSCTNASVSTCTPNDCSSIGYSNLSAPTTNSAPGATNTRDCSRTDTIGSVSKSCSFYYTAPVITGYVTKDKVTNNLNQTYSFPEFGKTLGNQFGNTCKVDAYGNYNMPTGYLAPSGSSFSCERGGTVTTYDPGSGSDGSCRFVNTNYSINAAPTGFSQTLGFIAEALPKTTGTSSQCSVDGLVALSDTTGPTNSINGVSAVFDGEADNWCNMVKYSAADYGSTTNPEIGGCTYYKNKISHTNMWPSGKNPDLLENLEVTVDDVSGVSQILVEIGESCTATYNIIPADIASIVVSNTASSQVKPSYKNITLKYNTTSTNGGAGAPGQGLPSLLTQFGKTRLDSCLKEGKNFMRVTTKDLARSENDATTLSANTTVLDYSALNKFIKIDNNGARLELGGQVKKIDSLSVPSANTCFVGGVTVEDTWKNFTMDGTMRSGDPFGANTTDTCEPCMVLTSTGLTCGSAPNNAIWTAPGWVNPTNGNFTGNTCDGLGPIPDAASCTLGCTAGKIYNPGTQTCSDPCTGTLPANAIKTTTVDAGTPLTYAANPTAACTFSCNTGSGYIWNSGSGTCDMAACGTANNGTYTSSGAIPSNTLCNDAWVPPTISTSSGQILWSCHSMVACSAILRTDGVCGTSSGTTLASAPTNNLCMDGSSPVVSGSGPWTWNCTGVNGGTTANCSAIHDTTTPYCTAGGPVPCIVASSTVTCGTASNGTYATTGDIPSSAGALCSDGFTAPITTSSSQYLWSCGVSPDTVSCSAIIGTANSCAAQPSYINATFTTGTPSSVGQAWVQNAASCGYSCTGGYTGVDCTTAPALQCEVGTNTITLTNGQIWSCLNVGASVVGTGASSYGNYYQWGRSDTGFTTVTLPYGDWQARNDDMWGDTTNTDGARIGPCDMGYHVPTHAEQVSAMEAITGKTSGWGVSDVENFQNILKLPKAGSRDPWDGSVMYAEQFGQYWSSSPYTINAYFLAFNTTLNADGGGGYRSVGMPVRCIQNATSSTSCPALSPKISWDETDWSLGQTHTYWDYVNMPTQPEGIEATFDDPVAPGPSLDLKCINTVWVRQFSCSSQPNYSHATFDAGTPTWVDETWQNSNSGDACYYTCTDGYTGNDCSIAPAGNTWQMTTSRSESQEPSWDSGQCYSPDATSTEDQWGGLIAQCQCQQYQRPDGVVMTGEYHTICWLEAQSSPSGNCTAGSPDQDVYVGGTYGSWGGQNCQNNWYDCVWTPGSRSFETWSCLP